TGFTTDLVTRIREHSTKRNPDSFTARYGVNQLVYYQGFLSIAEAEQAEKYIKGKTRAWKKALIDRHNSKWKDLSFEVKSALDEVQGSRRLSAEHSYLHHQCRKHCSSSAVSDSCAACS
ncbi:MAG TPA: GIY-YIG nuclease family protein, partial [Chryseosolibacter sp.]|nr:GIY-YIG nuclease family protein [Chryseosolibacter sp.]